VVGEDAVAIPIRRGAPSDATTRTPLKAGIPASSGKCTRAVNRYRPEPCY
jgi:hypothetical protein